ncbi:MAG: hypothetical protein JW712_14115 [Dehalococcoidales bacterium]|nr:hypothetical protein [Dehalococcoidales bacterium]
MQIRKKVLTYIGIVVYLFVAGVGGYILLQKMDEKDTLSTDLIMNQGVLGKVNSAVLEAKKEKLEADVSEQSSQTEVLKLQLSHDADNVDATSLVFTLAEDNDVKVLSLNAPSASDSYLNSIHCNVIVIQTSVEGDENNLVRFITQLNSELNTGVLQSVEIEISDSENVTSSAILLLEIYDYQGD